jgi:glutaryl-CoA dehydrogenase
MEKYSGLNFMEIDDLLNEEEIMVRDTVRKFVDDRIMPIIQKSHHDAKFPEELVPELGANGFLGANLSGYGLPGIGEVAYGLMMQELERGDSGIRSFCSVQGSLVMWPIFTYGSEEQKKKYLLPLCSGEKIGCFGLTEPDAGSDPGAMKTRAETVPKGYRLNGNKMWITNGSIADIAVVWAKLDNEDIRGFIVEKGTKGFSTTLMKGKYSLRASVTSELHFEDCEIPKESILPDTKGLKGALSCLSQARYGIAWGTVGAANGVYQTALDYAKDRIIFKKPMTSFQLVQAKLVKMVQEISKAQLLCIQMGRLKERGKLKHYHISLVKMNNCRMALECAREARDMLGASGIVDEYPVIRHMLNLESVNTYEGTEDIHRLIVGNEITGIRAFS